MPAAAWTSEREREAREGEASGKLGKLSVCPELPAPAARAIMCRARVVLVQAVQGREREADLALKRGSGQANAVAKTWDTARQVCTDKRVHPCGNTFTEGRAQRHSKVNATTIKPELN